MTEQNALNPYQSKSQQAVGSLLQTEQSRAIAEVQASLMIARANPRNEVHVMDRILNACTRPSLAENAIYEYAKGGTDVTGPTIRLAKCIAQQWGNINTGIRELANCNGESVVQAFAVDLEHNTHKEMTFVVPHIRYTKQGKKPLTDPRDIYEMIANYGARRLRACILAIIPGDVVEAAVKQCELTLHASADTSPEAILKMIEAFDKFGVTKEQLETRIQRRLDAIKPAQMVNLKKIYTSLRDGMSVPSEWFQIIKPAAKSVDDLLGDQPQAEPEAPETPINQDDYALGKILELISVVHTEDNIQAIKADIERLSDYHKNIAHNALTKRFHQLKQPDVKKEE